eukprot:COSAG02_NODE_7163_length_3146_cov_2.936331_1_plen_54_part_10
MIAAFVTFRARGAARLGSYPFVSRMEMFVNPPGTGRRARSWRAEDLCLPAHAAA